jgi:hypothetical protein
VRALRLFAALLSCAVLPAACSERTPTGPAGNTASGAAPSGVGTAARLAPRPLAPRATETNGPIGTWGSSGLNLTIGAASAVLEFDCAHGSIDQPFTVDSAGRFDLAGTFVAESPGPIGPGPLPTHLARYSGTTDGRAMTLTITLADTGQVLGPYRLTLGQAGRVVKCL